MADRDAAQALQLQNACGPHRRLRIRGGPRVVFRFTDGHVSLEGPGGPSVHCHVLAEPVALILVMYGRIPQWGPIAKGQLLTWGRRPWRALGFMRLFFTP